MPLPSNVFGGEVIASVWGNQVVANLPQIGTMIMFPGDPLPLTPVWADYLLCRGQAVSRATYATLWNDICKRPDGTGRFGNGDGTATFNLPDLRGRYPFGHNVGPATAGNPLAGTYGQVGVGQVFGFKDAVVGYHNHGVNIWSQPDDRLHSHVVPWGEPYQAWPSAPDNVDSFRVALAGEGSGFSIVIHKFNSASYPTTGQNTNHLHAINGASDTAGTDPTNGNLPPSVSLNFAIRAR